MNHDLEDKDETLSDKVIYIMHFAYSHIHDEITRSDIVKNMLLECYDKILGDRFVVLAEIYFMLNHLKKTNKIDAKKTKSLKKYFKNWVLTTSNDIEDVDNNTDNILSEIGIDFNEIDEIIYNDDNERNTKSEIKKIKQRLWECYINPNSKCRGRKIKKPGSVSNYRVVVEDDSGIPIKDWGPSFKDTQRTHKYNPETYKNVPKEFRKQAKWIQGASKDQTKLNDMNNFNELFSKLNIVDENVKKEILNLWDEVFIYSKIRKKSIKNRILYQLYTIKLVVPEINYIDLYTALMDITNDDNITPDAIYNPTIKTPNDTIREYFTIFFSKHMPEGNNNKGPSDLSHYIKQHHINIKPKYNIKELFHYLDDESYHTTSTRSHPRHIFGAKTDILKLLGLKMSKGSLITDENIPDYQVKDTRSPDVLASSIAKILGNKAYNSIVYFRVDSEDDFDPIFKRAKTDFVQSIISSENNI
jgi:hypothetical protein